MKVLITGGAGFLGAWLIRRLTARGDTIRVLDRSEDRKTVAAIAGERATAQVEWRTGDIARQEDVFAAARGCDAIVHLAALLTPACRANPILGVQVNLIGTVNVFEAAKTLGQRVAFASSAAVFGPDTATAPLPNTHYGALKLACESMARAYWAEYGVASVGFRPLVVYGPGREVGSSAGPTLACRAACAGLPFTIPFTGMTDLIFVDDVAAAFEAAITRPISGAHVFNLPGEKATIDQVIEIIKASVPQAELSSSGEPLPVTADLPPDDGISVLGRVQRTNLKDGLAQTLAFYRQ